MYNVKQALLAALGSALGALSFAHADERFVGDWTGVIQPAPSQSLTLVLHISETDDGYAVTMDSPDQGAMGLAGSEPTFIGDDITITFSFGAVIQGELHEEADPDEIRGTFQQSGLNLDVTFLRGLEAPSIELTEVVRPQVPQEPLPYDIEDVKIPVPGTDVVLAGTITRPTNVKGKHPAIILITGSGPQDRNEYLEIAEHSPFLVLSDFLTRQGITVLRYDDRGVAESTGTYATSSIQDFGQDAAAVLGYLEQHHKGPIGFLGHSEGGYTAASAFIDHGAKPDFIVSLAGPFVPLKDVLLRQTSDIAEESGIEGAQLAMNNLLQAQILTAATKGDTPEEACTNIERAVSAYPDAVNEQAKTMCSIWAFSMLRFDVAGAYEAYKKPVLALYGAKDIQVAADVNAAAAQELLKNKRSKVITFPKANHLFQVAETGSMVEYSKIEETMDPAVMLTISDWIHQNANPSWWSQINP